jgi:hypothetical protein|tara:strand:+ start:97 stop:1452 length:1356 start_codon:yes stop_codon:yes gene_type:complete
MAYIGRQLARGENKLFDDISSSFNGSTTVFNLTVSSVATSTATAFQLFVSLGGVMQKPNTDFTTAGNQITFTTAPAAGLSCWIMMQGDTIDQAAIPDASVTPSKIAGSGDFAFPADVRLKDGDGSHYVGFQSATTVSTSLVWTLPAADGSANQYLKTDGSGNLSWGSDSTSDPSKMPLAGGTFTGDVTFTGDASNGLWDKSASAFVANLTGNVTGNASGSAATVTGAAQSAITSVGTLTGLTISGDVTLTGAANNVVWDKSDNALEFADDARAKFGTDLDLHIYHNGSNSVIREEGTGNLNIQTTGGNVDILVNTTETAAKFISDGAVELYHNDVKKYETSAAGSKFTGGVSQVATAMGALELDLNTSNYFTKTISGNSTFTFANPAASGTVSIFMLELTHSSGTVTWPGTVKWNADTAPTLTTGKTHLFMFVTDDNGSRYRGSALVDYVN